MSIFGKVRHVFVRRTATTVTTSSRPMTPEEVEAFEAAFERMDDAFKRLDEMFSKPASDKSRATDKRPNT